MNQTIPKLTPVPSPKVPFVDLKRQQDMAMADIRKAFDRITNACSYIMGAEVTKFETEWADYCGAKYSVGCANGTDALVLMLLALGIEQGDEVITVSHTFFATVEAICSAGATPVLVDVLPTTALLDPAKLEAAITEKTKAVLTVHLYGQPVDFDPILAVCNKHNIPCLSDAAQAHGAKYNGKPISSYGLATSFSFFPGKNLGALGDAGAITTNDEGYAQAIRCIRDHGRNGKKYDHDIFGWNMRIDAMQAAFISAKLKYLNGWNNDRKAVAEFYTPRLKALGGLRLIETAENVRSANHLYVICHENRDSFKHELENRGLGIGIHYPHGVHRQPAWQTNYSPMALPETEYIADHCLSLPIFGAMTEDEAEIVVNSLAQSLDPKNK